MSKAILLLLLTAAVMLPLQGQDVKVTRLHKDIIILHPGKADDINEVRKAGGNVAAVRTDSGIVVFDSFISEHAAETGLKLILEYFPDVPVKYLINTHHHGDHTGGNSVFKNALSIAHENVQKRIPLKIDVSISADTVLFIGEKTFQLMYFGPAHTDSDIIILDKEDKLLIMGDLLCFRKSYILLPGSDVLNWINLLEKIIGRKDEYKYVIPGHGAVTADYSALAGQRDYLQDLYQSVQYQKKENITFEEAFKQMQFEAYKDYMLFEQISRDVKICWDQAE